MSYAKIAVTTAIAVAGIGGGGYAYNKLGPVNPYPISNTKLVAPVEPYRKVNVYFGTDREESPGKGLTERFGPARSPRDSVTYGKCSVSIPATHVKGGMESPSLLRLEFQPDPTKHIMVMSVDVTTQPVFIDSLRREYLDKENTALVFVHGWNTTFDEAARRTAQMAADLSYKGAPVFFSWPSNGPYGSAKENIVWAFGHIKQFMVDFIQDSKVDNVVLIAHSMGNVGALDMLQKLTKEFPEERSKIKEIILAAPDIDAQVFKRDIAPNIVQEGTNITLYASANDKALQASEYKIVNGNQRLGDTRPTPFLSQFIETIDASKVETSFNEHSYFARSHSVLSDIFHIVQHHIRAAKRDNLKAQTVVDGTYWELQPSTN